MKIHRIAAPLRQQVVANLRSAIADGRFVPGERLVERQLCELTGGSRTLVREALRQLETEGLIIVAPNRGPVVSVVGYDEAKKIYQIRQVLEPMACRLCAEAADDRLKQRLRAVFADLVKIYAKGDMSTLLRAKGAFYAAIFDGAGTKTLQRNIELMHVKINQLRAVSLAVPGRAKASLGDIGEIVEAICASDSARAWNAAEHHIGRADENAQAVLRKAAAA